MQNSVLGLPISYAAKSENPFAWRYKAMDNLVYATPFEWKQSAKDSHFGGPNFKKQIDVGSLLKTWRFLYGPLHNMFSGFSFTNELATEGVDYTWCS